MRRLLGVLAVFSLVLAGCSGGGADGRASGGESAGDEGAGASAGLDGSDTAREADSAGAGGGQAQPAIHLDPATRDIVHTVDLTVEVDDLSQAVQRAVSETQSAGGFVAAESTSGDQAATLTLRVPAERHNDIVTRLEQLGEVRERSRTAEDVTEEVIDVEARIASARRSIDRIRVLLDRATSLADVVKIESELATREADLDSLLQRQKELTSLTSLATVTVSFVVPGQAEPGTTDIGFVSGLRGGWNALVDAAKVAAAVIGALLPFAVAAGLIGGPVWWALRRRRRQTTPPTAVATATDQS